MTKKKYIIGNWKMHLNTHESSLYLHKLEEHIKTRRDVQVVVAPTTLTLQTLSMQINRHKMKLAAQNIYWRDFGPYTGEVSATQLRGVVDYALVGHSERRHVFLEGGRDIREKVQAAIRNDITPILCVGETQAERAGGETNDAIYDQVMAGLANTTSDDVSRVIIAYEPVWAIGTGNNATPADVKKAIKAIRSQVRHLFGEKAAEDQIVLYGGSVTQDSASDYLGTEGVDGLLVGGASLKLHEFVAIVEKAYKAGEK